MKRCKHKWVFVRFEIDPLFPYKDKAVRERLWVHFVCKACKPVFKIRYRVSGWVE